MYEYDEECLKNVPEKPGTVDLMSRSRRAGRGGSIPGGLHGSGRGELDEVKEFLRRGRSGCQQHVS